MTIFIEEYNLIPGGIRLMIRLPHETHGPAEIEGVELRCHPVDRLSLVCRVACLLRPNCREIVVCIALRELSLALFVEKTDSLMALVFSLNFMPRSLIGEYKDANDTITDPAGYA